MLGELDLFCSRRSVHRSCASFPQSCGMFSRMSAQPFFQFTESNSILSMLISPDSCIFLFLHMDRRHFHRRMNFKPQCYDNDVCSRRLVIVVAIYQPPSHDSLCPRETLSGHSNPSGYPCHYSPPLPPRFDTFANLTAENSMPGT